MSTLLGKIGLLAIDTGSIRSPDGWQGLLMKSVAAIIALTVVYTNTLSNYGVLILTVIFLSQMLTLTFLAISASSRGENSNRIGIIDGVLSCLSLLCGVYFLFHADSIETRVALFDPLSLWHVIVGITLILLTLEAMRRTVGLGLTGIVITFILYNLYGHMLPGVLGHGIISVNHFLDISLYTTDGLFGIPIRVAGSYVFLFVMFGTILSKTGGSEFFFQLAAWLSGRQPGGQAKVAVVSSGVYGMISGSPTSDVVTTGSITIPMMIRTGFRPAIAAAVEVASSAGGGLMPPVMGSAAFIMAEYTGIPYREIIIAAVIPALLYYLAIFMQVDVRARRFGLKGLNAEDIRPLFQTIKSGGLFVAPLVAVTWGLLSGYTPTFAGIFGVIATVIVALVYNAGKADWTKGPVNVVLGVLKAGYDLLSETTLRMVGVAGACAAAGLVIGTISMTGLAGKFSGLIIMLAGQNEFITLIFAGLLTIILGLGMPTPSAYILAAVLIGPRLIELNFPLMGSHLFLIYFAVLSALTPPVAVAAYAASAIARENPLKIAVYATRIAVVAFILPFVFVYSPELLMEGVWYKIIGMTLITCLAIVALSVGIEGYLMRALKKWERLLLIAAAISGMTLSITGVILLVIVSIIICIKLRPSILQ